MLRHVPKRSCAIAIGAKQILLCWVKADTRGTLVKLSAVYLSALHSSNAEEITAADKLPTGQLPASHSMTDLITRAAKLFAA